MFARTNKRLTTFFAGLMIVFLLSMNVTSYILLSSIIYKEQKTKLEAVVTSEIQEHSNEMLTYNNKTSTSKYYIGKEETNSPSGEIETPLRPFYMLIDHEGQIIRTDAVDEDLANDIKENVKEWIPQEKQTLHHIYDIDKENIHLFLAGRAVYREGLYVGSIIAGIDITEQQRLLEQVTYTQIIISVLFLIVSIIFAYAMSRRAMKPIIHSFTRQQKFTADASHELRTPLTVLHSSIEVLESETEDILSPFGKQVMEDMKDEVRRMTSLVSNLLTLAQADDAVVELTYDEFSLDGELERAFRNFQPITQQQAIEFVLNANTRVIVRGDQERLQQLFVILLDNAVQYTAAGDRILVKATVKGNLLTLQIQDTGIGIPKAKLQEVFERFSRVDESRNRTQGHTGLGLSIAKWIVESHGGTIWVESEVGIGSTFFIVLPIVSHLETT